MREMCREAAEEQWKSLWAPNSHRSFTPYVRGKTPQESVSFYVSVNIHVCLSVDTKLQTFEDILERLSIKKMDG